MALARLSLESAKTISRLLRLRPPAPAAMRVANSSSAANPEGGAGEDQQQKTVSVSEGGSTKSITPRDRRRRRRGWLWKEPWDLLPFHSGAHGGRRGSVGNVLMQLSDNLSSALERLAAAPARILGRRVKEDEDCYKVKLDVPGLGKDDVKITVEDGCLVISGERREEEESSEEEDGGWSSWQRYGYYNARLLLPEDAKSEEITAELKNGVLGINIPRSPDKKGKDVRHIEIH